VWTVAQHFATACAGCLPLSMRFLIGMASPSNYYGSLAVAVPLPARLHI
jgi:hypothetical protein